MRSKVFSSGETCINKSAFHKTTTSINIDEVDINKSHMVIEAHLNIILDIYIKTKPFHYH